MTRTRAGRGEVSARIHAVVMRIARGQVASYGQVAALAGLPGHARQVGWVLHALREDTELPWQRVVNARGEISQRSEPGGAEIQRQLLEAEGVVFDANGRIDLERHGWRPLAARAAGSKRARLPLRASANADRPRRSRKGAIP